MIPYFLYYPVMLIVSLAYPIFQSVEALHKKDQKEIKTWLFYWCLYAVAAFLVSIPGVESLISIPFGIVATIIDVYYEAQIGIVLALVNPKVKSCFLSFVNKYFGFRIGVNRYEVAPCDSLVV